MKSSIFSDITPRSPLKFNGRFGGTCHLQLQGRRIRQARNQHEALFATCFTLVSYLAYFSILTMEVTYSSETSVDFQRTTRLYIPEDVTLHNHRSKNLKSYIHLNVLPHLLLGFPGRCFPRYISNIVCITCLPMVVIPPANRSRLHFTILIIQCDLHKSQGSSNFTLVRPSSFKRLPEHRVFQCL
jgi:hypothetical protein